MSNDTDSLSNSTALGGRTVSMASNSLVNQGSSSMMNLKVDEKFDAFFLSDKLRKIADDICTIVRKRMGVIELTINNFSIFVIESMKEIENSHTQMNGSDKRTVIIQVLYLLFPEQSILIFSVLPSLIDAIVNLSKSNFKKAPRKRGCC